MLIPLVSSIVALFGLLIGVFAVFPPRTEAKIAGASAEDAWEIAGLSPARTQGFSLYQIAPTQSFTKAEFLFLDEYRRELGRYLATAMKSGDIQCATRTMRLLIQGSGINRTRYAGRVGGTSNNSIVIRDSEEVVAEAWRTRVLPVIEYKIEHGTRTFQMRMSSWSPTALGTIEQGQKQVAAIRRPRVFSRNTFVAFDKSIPDELKTVFMSLLLLR